MKFLHLKIERCGECPYFRLRGGLLRAPFSTCDKREIFPANTEAIDIPPSWCPLPDALGQEKAA